MGEFFPERQFSIEELRNIVAGNNTSIPRKEAIVLLASSDFPNKENDFESLLGNQEESSTIRYLADMCLVKINTPEARMILARNTQTGDDEVLAGIMIALGRIGNEQSLGVVLDVKGRTTGFTASQAEFAAALISYRLGLQGNDLPIPHSQDYLNLPSSAQQMQISKARDNEIRKCFQSLINEPFGIELAEKPAYQVYYDRGIGMVLFNLDLINKGNIQILLEKKTFLGVFADKIEETGWYSVAYLILTSPSEQSKQVNILVARPNGPVIFGGKADIEINNIKLSIRTISQVGVFPLLLEGTIIDNKLELTTAQFSTIIQKKNQAELYTPQ